MKRATSTSSLPLQGSLPLALGTRQLSFLGIDPDKAEFFRTYTPADFFEESECFGVGELLIITFSDEVSDTVAFYDFVLGDPVSYPDIVSRRYQIVDGKLTFKQVGSQTCVVDFDTYHARRTRLRDLLP